MTKKEKNSAEVKERKEGKEVKKLYRSSQQRIIAGVCGGFGEYFKIDPVWIRILWILFIFLDGIGIVAYIICWIVIPQNPNQKIKRESGSLKSISKGARLIEKKAKAITESCESKNLTWFGTILLIVGAFFLFEEYIFRWVEIKRLWSITVIILGVILVYKGLEEREKIEKKK